MTVTIKDVSIDAGVSIKTVSRVITNEVNVVNSTKNKVFVSIDKLGFQNLIKLLRVKMKRSYLSGSVLLIDIGGTNIRSAIADIGSNEIKNVKKQKLDSWIHLI